MAELLTFDAAEQWLDRRVSLPTARDAARISAEMPENVRQHAFFSARVTQANVLDALRSTVGEIAAGRMTYEDGRNRLQSFLASQGVGQTELLPDAAGYDKAAEGVRNIASTRRLDLVLRQNVRMAHAIGQRQVGMAPEIAARWPYWRYVARMDGRERPSHGELNNLVLRKDDPFWASHTPPWEFGCRCRLEHCDEEEAAQYGGASAAVVSQNADGGTDRAVVSMPSGRAFEVLLPENGFEFRPDEAFAAGDMSLVRNVKDRRQILQETMDRLQKSGSGWRIVGSTGIDGAAPRPPEEEPAIASEMRRLSAEVVAGRTTEREIPLGRLLQEHADALGIDPEETGIRLVSHAADVGQVMRQKQAKRELQSVGTRHWNVNHAEWMRDPEQIMRMLSETAWNPAAALHIDIRPKKRPVMVIDGGKGKALLSLAREGKSWMLDFLSAWRPNEDYREGFAKRI